MSRLINSTIKAIWTKMKRKAYRDSYVAAHLSNTVAAQIAMMRDVRGWTQSELAKRAGMKQPRISALEDPNCENFEVDTLKRLASAFDVALTIRFEPFSEAVAWASSMNDAKLAVASYEENSIDWCPASTATDHIISLGTARNATYAVADPSTLPKMPSHFSWQTAIQ